MSAPHTTRRTMLTAAGAAGLAVGLAACGGSGESAEDEADTQDQPTGKGEDGTSGTGEGSDQQEGGELAQTSEIPQGQGKVFRDEKIVVTQPTSGEFKAYSALCTHQSCLVSEVSEGSINCTCHGSKFSIIDGNVTAGPAQQPLEAAKITVDGDSIRLG